MTGTADRSADLTMALGDVRRTIAATRAALERVRARATTTSEERQALLHQALGGSLGADMQTLAGRIRSGATTWADVFAGLSPDADLLCDHLDRMIDEHGDGVRRVLAGEPDFDPRAPHEGV